MDNLQWVKDEEVVFCPNRDESFTRFRGASGTIISRQVGGRKGKKKVRSVLIRWKMHRKGVSCFRLRGQKRAKSDAMTKYLRSDKLGRIRSLYGKDDVLRFEEESKSLHPISFCSDCPLRLKRLMCPCEMDKRLAVATDGKGVRPGRNRNGAWWINPLTGRHI